VNQKYELTSGGILSKLLLVALPIMGSQLVQMAYNLTDMFWLGRIDSASVAASGTAGLFMWLSMGLLLIGRMGAEIGVSQNLGKGSRDAARVFSQNAVMTGAALGVAFAAVLAVFRHSLVGFFNIQDLAVEAATEKYLLIVSFGLPFAYVNSAIVGSFNASGNSRTPFLANIIGLAINMILDPLMIFAMDMGVAGAATATLAAQAISCGVGMLAIKCDKNRPFAHYRFMSKPNIKTLRQIFLWSAPIAAESAFFTLMAMITSRFEASFGTNAMAAGRIGSQVESLTWLVGGGFGSALIAFTGQNFGAGKWTRIRRCFKLSVFIMTLYGIGVTALMFFGGEFAFNLFLPDPGVVRIGIGYMRIFAMCQVFFCLEGVAGSAFKGVGRTFPPSIVSIIANIIRVFLALALSRSELGLYGVWLGISLSAVLRGTAALIWYLIEARGQPLADEETTSESDQLGNAAVL
jgi:putative MATE family efflux protein